MVRAFPSDGCLPLKQPIRTNSTVDYYWIALIERGDCHFETKVLNAQNAGASFAFIFNNDPTSSDLVSMSGASKLVDTVVIPSAFISYKSGKTLLDLITTQETNGNVGLPISIIVDESLEEFGNQWAVIVFIGILAILISTFFIMMFLVVEIYRQRRRRLRSSPKPTPPEVIFFFFSTNQNKKIQKLIFTFFLKK